MRVHHKLTRYRDTYKIRGVARTKTIYAHASIFAWPRSRFCLLNFSLLKFEAMLRADMFKRAEEWHAELKQRRARLKHTPFGTEPL